MDAKEQALLFLDSIKPEDKIALVFHDDLDGFASGILLYDFLKKKNVTDITHFIITIGKKSLKNFDMADRNKLIIADLGPNVIEDGFPKMMDKEVLYIDHHKKDVQIPSNIIEIRTEDKFSASRSVFELVGGKDWLAIAGMIADVGDRYAENMGLINSILKKYDFSLQQFKEKIVYTISESLLYFEGDFEKAFSVIYNIDSIEKIGNIKKYSDPIKEEIANFVDGYEKNKERLGGINFYYFEPHYQVKSIVCNKISNENLDEIFVFANPEGDTIRISARNQTARADMVDLLRETMKNLSGSKSGGHPASAGGNFNRQDLEKFKENLRNYQV